ncbi:MAG TPA: hypothetical protein PLS95_01165 [Thermoanaerobaculales bacterium]|jgi:hypothetical protein|nr:hypothetical protein [Thermoanaerobaculales bacterium]
MSDAERRKDQLAWYAQQAARLGACTVETMRDKDLGRATWIIRAMARAAAHYALQALRLEWELGVKR